MVTSAPKTATTGFVIDLNTILTKTGGQTTAAPGARDAVSRLQEDNIAFSIVSTDARTTEKHVKHELETHLGLVVKSRFIVMPQTPSRDLVDEYRDKVVLVVGDSNGRARTFAQDYGFQHVMTPNDIVELYPHIYCDPPANLNRAPDGSLNPPWKPALSSKSGSDEVRIAAILVWWGPSANDWDRDLRIVTDVLLSQAGYLGTHSTKNIGHLKHSPEKQPRLFVCGAGTSGRHAPARRGRTWLKALQRQFRNDTRGLPLAFTYLDDADTLLNHADRALQYVNAKLHPHLTGHGACVPFPRTVFRIISANKRSNAESASVQYTGYSYACRRTIVIDASRGGRFPAVHEYGPPEARPWHVAASLPDAVDHALTDEYWECVEAGLKPMWPTPKGALELWR